MRDGATPAEPPRYLEERIARLESELREGRDHLILAIEANETRVNAIEREVLDAKRAMGDLADQLVLNEKKVLAAEARVAEVNSVRIHDDNTKRLLLDLEELVPLAPEYAAKLRERLRNYRDLKWRQLLVFWVSGAASCIALVLFPGSIGTVELTPAAKFVVISLVFGFGSLPAFFAERAVRLLRGEMRLLAWQLRKVVVELSQLNDQLPESKHSRLRITFGVAMAEAEAALSEVSAVVGVGPE